MFNRIVNFFRDVRIKIDFSGYEKQCRIEHERRAEATYSTRQLESELSAKTTQINERADSLFRAKISNINGEVTQLRLVVSQKEAILKMFLREYSKELQELYEQKKTLFSQKENAFNRIKALDASISAERAKKDEAYASVNYYQGCISAWHAKSKRSPWLLGNGGKKLPKHAFFGQSFGDLDSYKSSRDSAYREVQEAKNTLSQLNAQKKRLGDQISQIKNDIAETNQKINSVKSDRSRMHELKKEGQSRSQLQKALIKLNQSLRALQANLNSLEVERREFLVAERYKHGVIDLEGIIQNVRDKKKEFLKSFDSEEMRNLRIKEHRKIWMQGKGMS